MNLPFDKVKKILTTTLTKAFNDINQDKGHEPENFTVEELYTYDGEYEDFRLFKVHDALGGDHGIAYTCWFGNNLTEIVWTYDKETDLLYSVNNCAAIVYDKDVDTTPKESEDVITEDADGNELFTCPSCKAIGFEAKENRTRCSFCTADF